MAVKSAIAIVALKGCANLKASVACEALLLHQVFQSGTNVYPSVLFLVVLDILVIL